jgi:hypothetical protein
VSAGTGLRDIIPASLDDATEHRDGSAAIAAGWIAWRAAMNTPWPSAGEYGIARAVAALRDALDLYDDIRDGMVHNESAYPETADEPEPVTAALEQAARDAADLATDLNLIMRRWCGGDIAAPGSAARGGN